MRIVSSMTALSDPFDGLVITFKPEATPEEEERFIAEFADAVIAVARHLVEKQNVPADSDADSIETPEL